MKYTITIEHDPSYTHPFFAIYEEKDGNRYVCAGSTPKEAENDLRKILKKLPEKQQTITKEIEI